MIGPSGWLWGKGKVWEHAGAWAGMCASVGLLMVRTELCGTHERNKQAWMKNALEAAA